MKRVLTLAAAVALLVVSANNGRAEFEKTKLAVLDFQQQGTGFETSDMGKIIAEWLITALVKEGRFDVVERRMLEKVLAEQQLAVSGLLDAKSTTELGRLLGVKVIISGSVMKLQNLIEVNARIIDVQDASIIAAESVKSDSAVRLEALVGQMAEIIIRDFPLEGYVVDREGDTVIIDLGRTSGVRQGLRFVVYKEGKTIKHPRTGQVLDVEKIQTGVVEVCQVRDNIAEGTLVEETPAGAVAYGQQVKSVTHTVASVPMRVLAPLGPAPAATPVVVPPPRLAAPAEPPTAETDLPPGLALQLSRLRSSNSHTKRDAAKTLARSFPRHPAALEAANQELLAGYQSNSEDDDHVDAMSWLCKVLGASRDTRYAETLRTVAGNTNNRKLRKYAENSLDHLR